MSREKFFYYSAGGNVVSSNVLVNISSYASSASSSIGIDKKIIIDEDGVIIAFFEIDNHSNIYGKTWTMNVYKNDDELTPTLKREQVADVVGGWHNYAVYTFNVSINDSVRFVYNSPYQNYTSQAYFINLPDYHNA